MRSDMVPAATFPDYELPDQDRVTRRLSEIQGDDPLILTLARGHYCPKEHQQHLELAASYPKIAKIEWKPKKNPEAPFFVSVPDVLQDVFFIEKDSKRFPNTKGWAYVAFDYVAASDTFVPNKDGKVNCGFACHSKVAAKDYIFTAYGKR